MSLDSSFTTIPSLLMFTITKSLTITPLTLPAPSPMIIVELVKESPSTPVTLILEPIRILITCRIAGQKI